MIEVKLCCDLVTNTMSSNLWDIDGSRAHVIVTTLGRLKNIDSETATRNGFSPDFTGDLGKSQGLSPDYVRRCLPWIPLHTVKVVVFDQASDMLSGDYHDEIDLFQKAVIPKLADDFSLILASADMGDGSNAATCMAEWLDQNHSSRRSSLLLEADAGALFSNILLNIDIVRVPDGIEGHAYIEPDHLFMRTIKITGRTLFITGTRHKAELLARWVTTIENGRFADRVGTCHGGLNREAIPRMQEDFFRGDLDVMCATSGMVRGRNLKVHTLYIMFFPTFNKSSRGIKNILDDIARTGRMGMKGCVKLVFGPDDGDTARVYIT